MFKCQITGNMSKLGEKVNKIVTKTRDKVYTANVFNEELRVNETIEVGRGWEIVSEINASEEGLRLWNSWTPGQRAIWFNR